MENEIINQAKTLLDKSTFFQAKALLDRSAFLLTALAPLREIDHYANIIERLLEVQGFAMGVFVIYNEERVYNKLPSNYINDNKAHFYFFHKRLNEQSIIIQKELISRHLKENELFLFDGISHFSLVCKTAWSFIKGALDEKKIPRELIALYLCSLISKNSFDTSGKIFECAFSKISFDTSDKILECASATPTVNLIKERYPHIYIYLLMASRILHSKYSVEKNIGLEMAFLMSLEFYGNITDLIKILKSRRLPAEWVHRYNLNKKDFIRYYDDMLGLNNSMIDILEEACDNKNKKRRPPLSDPKWQLPLYFHGK